MAGNLYQQTIDQLDELEKAHPADFEGQRNGILALVALNLAFIGDRLTQIEGQLLLRK